MMLKRLGTLKGLDLFGSFDVRGNGIVGCPFSASESFNEEMPNILLSESDHSQ